MEGEDKLEQKEENKCSKKDMPSAASLLKQGETPICFCHSCTQTAKKSHHFLINKKY